jgi:citrate synthase|tara:strand:- start:5119 stop:6258 length:1140 start_codon:yes stop_codon:yes gene_type:complete
MVNKSVKLYRGLQGVYFDRTRTTFIDGGNGILEYRGYNIHDLAEKSTFEEVSYLLIYGDLPNREQLDTFNDSLKEARNLPEQIFSIIDEIKNAHPMDVLRTAVSALASFDEDRENNTIEGTIKKGIRLTSQVPTIVMAHYNIRNGNTPIEPNQNLNHAGNFLYMLNGKIPSQQTINLMDKDFILHADHGSNASAFTARVVASTNADIHGAITAGIAALSGPSHGGAAENVMQMAKEIESPEKAESYVKTLLANRERVMGFGHRVYRSEDPRARHLKEGVKRLSAEVGQPQWYQILVAVQKAMSPYSRRGIHVNVDFFAGVIYYLSGIPQDLFVPIFAVGRIPGWVIQVIEQYEHNILIRPLLQYTGQRERKYIPLQDRA